MVVFRQHHGLSRQIGQHQRVVDDHQVSGLGSTARLVEEALIELRAAWPNTCLRRNIDSTPGSVLAIHEQQLSLVASAGRRQPELNFEQRSNLLILEPTVGAQLCVAAQTEVVAATLEQRCREWDLGVGSWGLGVGVWNFPAPIPYPPTPTPRH